MAIKIKIDADLKNTETLIKRLKKLTPVVVEAGESARDRIVNNWLKGRGGDGKTLQSPKINRGYRTRKLDLTGRGKVDMNLRGSMIRAFHSSRERKNVAKITTDRQNMPKLKGNYSIRESIMKVSKKIAVQVGDIIFAYLVR